MSNGLDFECQQIVEMVSDYLEGCLLEDDRVRFETHVERCVSCTRYLDQIWRVVLAVRKLPPEKAGDASKERLLLLFREWKKEA